MTNYECFIAVNIVRLDGQVVTYVPYDVTAEFLDALVTLNVF